MLNKQELAYAFQMADWKIERAKKHISDTEEIVRWVVDPSRYVTIPERNFETGHYGCHIGLEGGKLPHHLPCVVGDAVHNLASTLDFLWNGLIRSAVPGEHRRTRFPSHEERQGVANEVRKAPIHQAFPQAEALILDKIRPYKDGNFLIWAIHKLDNIDKHRLLISTFAVTRFGKFIATMEDGGGMNLSGMTVYHKGDNLRLGFGSPFKLNDDVGITADIMFDEAGLLADQPITETLVNITQAVSKVVQAFRETFL